MLPFNLTTSQIIAFMLIFARISAILFTAPIFNSPRVPLQLRIGISLLLTFLLQPVVAPAGPEINGSVYLLALMVAREIVVGLVIGYIANLLFSIVEMAGDMQDTQAGFGFAGSVDPTFSQPRAILGQFQLVLMWLIFLAVNGHHVLLTAIAQSFDMVPLGKFAFDGQMAMSMLRLVATLMSIAVRISAPIIGAVLLADLGLGALQRTAPQLNIMAVGFQVKIAVAVVVLGLALPFILSVERNLAPYIQTMLQPFLSPVG